MLIPGLGLALLASVAVACGEVAKEAAPAAPATEAAVPDEHGFTAPSDTTADANARFGAALPLDEAVDFEEARRSLVASDPDMQVRTAAGRVRSQRLFASPSTSSSRHWPRASTGRRPRKRHR